MSAPWDDLVLEIYVDSAWVDLKALGLVRGTVAVKRGRDDESTKAQYSTCTATLDDRAGWLSPRNPLSPWYGHLRRNVPLRVWVRPHLSTGAGKDDPDTWQRTIAEGWGSTPAGTSWESWFGGGTVTGTDFSVSYGKGNLSVPAAGAYRLATLSAMSIADVDVTATCTSSVGADIAGADVEPAGIMVRTQIDGTITDGILCRVEIAPDETMAAVILHGSDTLASAALGFAWTSGLVLGCRVRAIGDEVSYRVWDASGAEPTPWTCVADTTLLIPGAVGLRCGVASGNTNTKPVVFAWDDLTIEPIAPRFSGEVSEWPLTWTLGGHDVTTTIQACGILRRLSQGDKTPRSPLERAYHAMPEMVAHFPLTDQELAVAAEDGLPDGGVPLAVVGDVDMGKVQGPIGAPYALPELARDITVSEVAMTADVGLSVQTYTVDLMVLARRDPAAEEDPGMPPLIFTPLEIRDPDNFFYLVIYSDPDDDKYVAFGGNDFGLTASVEARIDVDIADGQWHHLRIEVSPTGGITVGLLIDDTWYGSSTDAGMTPRGIARMDIYNNRKYLVESASCGQIAIFAGVSLSTTYDAFIGHETEQITARAARLAAQDHVDIEVLTDDDSPLPLLTAQRTAPLPDLLADIEASDMGILVESRSHAALVLRALGTLYRQTPITLSYSGYQLASGLVVTDDDQRVWNDVTARRWGGSSVRAVELSGPLGTALPPTGAGTYDRGEYTTHVDTSERLRDVATWIRHLGTWDDPRWPVVPAQLAAPDVRSDETLIWQLLTADVGDTLLIEDPPSWVGPDDPRVMIRGYTEAIGPKTWRLDYATSPARPYDVGVTDTLGYLDCDGSTLSAGVTSSATSLPLDITDLCAWTHDDGDYDIIIGGERMTLTAVSAVSGTYPARTQTLTVTRSVNGIVKAHAAGTEVHVADPFILAYQGIGGS